MSALITIVWFLSLLLAIALVFQFIGMRLMVSYFPEGRRWWMLPTQLGSLAFFAALIHFNPF